MVLKITRDELPMEWGVYGGCLLCPLYPLLNFNKKVSSFTDCFFRSGVVSFRFHAPRDSPESRATFVSQKKEEAHANNKVQHKFRIV